MYYSYYCNEKMLLDNFDDYNESPRLLRRLLAQSGYEPDFCADMQLAHTDPKYIRQYDRLDLIQQYKKKQLKKCGLRQVDKIYLYESDLTYIRLAIRTYGLTQRQVKVLLGVIVMCRLNGSDTLDLMNRYRIKQFCSCFGRDVTTIHIDGANWWDGYEAPVELDVLSDKCGILNRITCKPGPGRIGCLYEYPFYDHKSEGVYCWDVTAENNRLNMDKLCAKIGLFDNRYCEKCGEEIAWNAKAHYCKTCAELEKNAKTLARVTRYRSKNNTL